MAARSRQREGLGRQSSCWEVVCNVSVRRSQGKRPLLLPSVVSWLTMMQVKPRYSTDGPDLVGQPPFNAQKVSELRGLWDPDGTAVEHVNKISCV